MGRLEIRVCGARNIANLQKVGKPDPYVKVKMGDKKKTQIKYKTRVIENNLNPVWNELFKFQVADYDSTQVLFEVWNDNVLVDDLLGSYSLSIDGLTRGVVKDMWAILTGTKGSSSELHLRILAVDFGRDPAPTDVLLPSLEQDNLQPPTNQTYRPPKNYTPAPSGVVVQQGYPAAPQGPPQPVVYGQPQYGAPMNTVTGGYSAMPPAPPQQPPQQPYGYGAPPQPQQQPYGYGAPPQPQQQQPYGYGAPPPPSQPMFGAPPPPQRPPYMGGGPPPPPPQQPYGYGAPMGPPQPGVQMAYGVPPDM